MRETQITGRCHRFILVLAGRWSSLVSGPVRGRNRPRSGPGGRRLQPAALFGDAVGLDAVAGAGLADARRQVVAYGALGQADRSRDLLDGRAVGAGREDIALARGERAGALRERRRGEVGVDDALAVPDLADGRG